MTIDIIFIAALMAVGLWLETINGKHGLADELFSPIPLGLFASVVVMLEHT